MSRELTREQVLQIQDIFIRTFRDFPMPKGSYAELWYNVIDTFLAWSGAEIISTEVRDAEQLVIEREQSEEYIEALKGVVKAPEVLSDDAKLVFLVMASNEQREEALKRVFR